MPDIHKYMHNKNTNRKKTSGIVYSTNPDFIFEPDIIEEPTTLLPENQNLKIKKDTKSRKGKTVTIISGFTGKISDLQALEKDLKSFCSSGGTSKEGEIIIQGDMKEKIFNYLISKGYKVKKIN